MEPILLWCKNTTSNLFRAVRSSLLGNFVMLLWERSSFMRLLHLLRKSRCSVMSSLPARTSILSLSGAMILRFSKDSVFSLEFLALFLLSYFYFERINITYWSHINSNLYRYELFGINFEYKVFSIANFLKAPKRGFIDANFFTGSFLKKILIKSMAKIKVLKWGIVRFIERRVVQSADCELDNPVSVCSISR